MAHNDLRNVPFWLAKQAVLEAETCRFASQNGLFHPTKLHIWLLKAAKSEFMLISRRIMSQSPPPRVMPMTWNKNNSKSRSDGCAHACNAKP